MNSSHKTCFFTYGDRWKVEGQNMTPIFMSVKMKNMFYLKENCSHTFQDLLDKDTRINNVIEVKSLVARFTMECIGSCVFGVDMNSMGDNFEENLFRHKIMNTSTYGGLKWISRLMWPALFYRLGFKMFSADISKFFHNLVMNTFKGRNYKPTPRNDFIDCILAFYNNKYITGDSISNAITVGSEKVSLQVDSELMVGMCVVFFAAGFDTSSITSANVLFELAKDKVAQKRVREEIDEYLRVRGNKLGYDCVSELPFTEACIDETLRFYPVLSVITRELVEDYTLPTGLTLENSLETRVHIRVYHLHSNPKYFADPETFRLERMMGLLTYS